MFKERTCWKNELEYIKSELYSGKKLIDLAKHFGVTRQRIEQVCSKNKIYIKEIKREINKDSDELKWKAYLKKWGDKKNTEKYLYIEQRKKFRGKKANAIRQGIEFTLDFSDLAWPTTCPILGIELDYFSSGVTENSPSFDRIDPRIGYTKENTRIVSWRGNRIKNDGSLEEHKLIVKYLENS